MRRLNNINEEINRMKSLFTEERMFGNLVENEEVINESNLKVGSKGEGVKALQTLLGIESDGIFGPKTKEAVIKMQKEAGLNVDGIVGPKTLEGIEKKMFTPMAFSILIIPAPTKASTIRDTAELLCRMDVASDPLPIALNLPFV